MIGEVLIEGRPTLDWDPIALRRHIGYVIQDTGLFPHYTVEQNISLVPKPGRLGRQPASARGWKSYLALVGLCLLGQFYAAGIRTNFPAASARAESASRGRLQPIHPFC